MSDWSDTEIGDLLDGQWPGEWGTDPTPGSDSVRVYRSTEIDNFGRLDEDGGVYRCIPQSQMASKSLRPGDILLEASGGTPGRPVGRVGRFVGEHYEAAMCANFLRVLRPKKEVSSDFVRWALLYLHSRPEIWRFQQQTTGMSNLKVSDYLRHRIPVPGTEIQPRIAEILSTVDEAIEQTEALIAKTQQIKAGLMHDLFTRGVTPDSQLRPPREEAPQFYKESPLGWIPKEWNDAKLGSVIGRIDSGWSPICAAEQAGDGEWAVLKTTAVVWPGYDPAENKALLPGADRLEGITVKKDDILITRKGPVDRVGVAVHVPKTPPNLMFPDTVFRTRVITPSEVSPDFLALAMGSPSVQKFWWQRKVGLADAQVNLNHGILRKTPIAKPSLDEQRAICERSGAFNEALAHLANEVRKLKAEKAGLMHDLLTGQVSVQISARADV